MNNNNIISIMNNTYLIGDLTPYPPILLTKYIILYLLTLVY